MQPCLETGIDKVVRIKQHQGTADVSLGAFGRAKWMKDSAGTEFCFQSVPAIPLLLLTCGMDASSREGR